MQPGTNCAPSVIICQTSYKEQKRRVTSSCVAASRGSRTLSHSTWSHTTKHMLHVKCHLHQFLDRDPSLPTRLTVEKRKERKETEKYSRKSSNLQSAAQYLPSSFHVWAIEAVACTVCKYVCSVCMYVCIYNSIFLTRQLWCSGVVYSHS